MNERELHVNDVLSDRAWEQVCEMLNNDILSLGNKGVCIVASCSGDEPTVSICVEHDRMNWIVNQPERLLSQAVLEDNPNYPNSDEVERIITGLRVTIERLEAALAAWRANAPA